MASCRRGAAPVLGMSTTVFDEAAHPRQGNGRWEEKTQTDQGDGALGARGSACSECGEPVPAGDLMCEECFGLRCCDDCGEYIADDLDYVASQQHLCAYCREQRALAARLEQADEARMDRFDAKHSRTTCYDCGTPLRPLSGPYCARCHDRRAMDPNPLVQSGEYDRMFVCELEEGDVLADGAVVDECLGGGDVLVRCGDQYLYRRFGEDATVLTLNPVWGRPKPAIELVERVPATKGGHWAHNEGGVPLETRVVPGVPYRPDGQDTVEVYVDASRTVDGDLAADLVQHGATRGKDGSLVLATAQVPTSDDPENYDRAAEALVEMYGGRGQGRLPWAD